jgi:hypothetical protein
VRLEQGRLARQVQVKQAGHPEAHRRRTQQGRQQAVLGAGEGALGFVGRDEGAGTGFIEPPRGEVDAPVVEAHGHVE